MTVLGLTQDENCSRRKKSNVNISPVNITCPIWAADTKCGITHNNCDAEIKDETSTCVDMKQAILSFS